jgi:hypothetical protein
MDILALLDEYARL